jgi:hypothetical protein
VAKSMKDRVMRSLRLLADKPAHQLRGRPLETIVLLIRKGHAVVSRRYTEHANGRDWECEEVVITDEGRAALTNNK